MSKNRKTAEYGDFQTPDGLARTVCTLLARQRVRPLALVEPTCGLGRFLFAGLDQFEGVEEAVGVEVNPDYVRHAESVLLQRADKKKVRLEAADFFETNWAALVSELPKPVLVLGNLPWVTNAHLGTLASQNLPPKSNFQNRNGLDAITGKANFDISEWMLLRLIEAMNGTVGTLAILCKSAVARKALFHAWTKGVALTGSAIYRIDASAHFHAAVDAALLVAHFMPGKRSTDANVFSDLSDGDQESVLGFEDGLLLANVPAYQRWKHLCGESEFKWRSGIKHDCSKVMELSREGNKYRNGLGELIDIEDTFVYPMLKSSHLANGNTLHPNRFMLVTQRSVGADTFPIAKIAPRTWGYLAAHADHLEKRASSIYRNRACFSIFGVGDYSFTPWKVAISGFYKKLAFVVVGPFDGKPIVVDDTSYFLPCQTNQQAELLAELLNSDIAHDFFGAYVFWDAKRPITADLLRRLDLRRLSQELGLESAFETLFLSPENELLLWK